MPLIHPAPPDDLVTFNVRGRHFQTTRTTLRRFPDSIFLKMVDYAQHRNQFPPAETQTPGSFFIDRDPDLFAAILRYHDMVEFDIESLCSGGEANTLPVTRKLLFQEAEYYNIQNLLDSITNIKSSPFVKYEYYVLVPYKKRGSDTASRYCPPDDCFELSEEIGKSYTTSALGRLQYADSTLLDQIQSTIAIKSRSSDGAEFRWTLWTATSQAKGIGMVIVIRGDRRQ
jgi:BTB/POZ domain